MNEPRIIQNMIRTPDGKILVMFMIIKRILMLMGLSIWLMVDEVI